MLTIHIADQQLDLQDDFSVALILKSPVFNDIGDYTFPFKIPSTIKNMSILGWKNRIASSGNIYEIYEGSIRWNGKIMFIGTIKIKAASDKTFEGSLYFDKGNFNYQAKDLVMNSIDYGMMNFETEDDAITYFNWTLTHLYPESDFAMPEIKNDMFFDPPTLDPQQQTINRLYDDNLLHKTTTSGHRTILIPFFYLKFVLKKITEYLGYELQDEFFSKSTQLSRLVIYNSVNVSEIFFGLQQFYFFRNMPNAKLGEFISGLEKWFNCSFHVNHLKKVVRIVSNTDVLLNSEIIEFSKNILSISHQINEQILGYQLIRTPDGGDPFYKSQLEFEFSDIDNVKGCVQNFSDIPPYPFTWLGDIYYVINTDVWWQLGTNPISFLIEWQVLPVGPSLIDKFYYRWATDKNKIETIFSTLIDRSGQVECGNLGADHKKDTPRLFWVAWVGGYIFPYRLYGLADDSNFSLRYPGANGLVNKFWKQWLNWQMDNAKYVWIEKQMDFVEFKDFDFTKRYRINGINYLVSEIAVTLNKSSIKSAQLKCYTAL